MICFLPSLPFWSTNALSLASDYPEFYLINPFTRNFFMANQTLGLDRQFYSYYQSICLREPPILAQLRQETASQPLAVMQIAPEHLDQLIAGGESNSFDFVFIDADKSNYDPYYERALQLVRRGGIIAIDNVFWSGRVAAADSTDNRTKIIRSLNAKIQQDERVNISIIPIGDGLTLAMKK